jgi:hypothetical protein
VVAVTATEVLVQGVEERQLLQEPLTKDTTAVHQLLYLAMALHLEAAVEVHLR